MPASISIWISTICDRGEGGRRGEQDEARRGEARRGEVWRETRKDEVSTRNKIYIDHGGGGSQKQNDNDDTTKFILLLERATKMGRKRAELHLSRSDTYN